MRNLSFVVLPLFTLLTALATGCSDDGVDSDEEARRAYLGLDGTIAKSLNLGMDGFNAADSANIPEQSDVGDESGTLVVNGQVDQGSSDNKGMRLYVDLTEYSDGPIIIDEESEETIEVVYDTDESEDAVLPYLELSLRDIPDGTFTGSLNGDYFMSGEDLDGTVTLSITMAGEIEDDGAGGIQRVVGTTTVTGIATNPDDGVYDIDITL